MNFKKLLVLGVTVTGLLWITNTPVKAATYQTPAQIVATLTDRSIESIILERRETGKTYGTIAKEAGVLEEFQKEQLNQKEIILDEKVADGILTQEEADEILSTIKENQLTCDGTGYVCNNLGYGIFGQGQNGGNGRGFGRGAGRGCWRY